MLPQFDYGDEVRVTRNVRNDGTYPGLSRGELLVKRGSVGYVRDIGTFLQDQIIYSVHFVDAGDRLVGCREQELIPADAPWTPSRFEFRDKVKTRLALSVQGEVLVDVGSEGQVFKVLRDSPGEVHYHVLFPGRMLRVPESALETSGAGV